MIAGSLEIQMLANMARLSKDMADAKGIVGGAMKNIESAVASAKSALGALGIGLSAGYFVSLIKASIDAADNLKDLSQSTAIAVETLAGIGIAAKQSGGDLNSIAAAINKLSQNIGKDGEKFRALGITAKEPIEAFKQLADIYVALEDPQQRAAVMAAALGKSWAGAAPLLAEGGKKMGEMIATGTQLSGVTKEITDRADEFNDKLTLLGGTGGILTRQIGPLLPLLIALADDMLEAQKNATGMGESFSPLAETFRAIVILGAEVAYTFKSIGAGIGIAAATIGAFARGEFKEAVEIQRMAREDMAKGATEHEAYIKRMAEMGKTTSATTKEVKELSAADKAAAAAAAAAAAKFLETAKAAKDAYEKLIIGIKEKTLIAGLENDATEKLTDGEKTLAKVMAGLNAEYNKLTLAQQANIKALLAEQIAAEKVITAREAMAAAIMKQYDAIMAGIAADELIAKASADLQAAYDALAGPVEERARSAEREIELYGMTTAQIEALNLARLQEARNIAAVNGALPEHIAFYDRLIESQGRLTDAVAKRETFDKQVDGWREVERAGHSVFTAIFDSGKSAFDRLKAVLKNGLIEFLYQMTAKKWFFNIAASVSGSGVAGAANAAGSSGGIASGMSDLLGFGSLPGIGTALGNLGFAFTDFFSLMNTGIGLFDAAGMAFAGMGSSFMAVLGPIGAAVAVISMLMSKGGGPKTEGDFFGILGAGGALTRAGSATTGDGQWYTGGSADATVAQLGTALGKSIYDTIRMLGGSSAGIGINLGYNTDPAGTAPDNVAAGVSDARGNVIYRQTYDVDRGGASAAMQTEFARMTLAAIKAANIGGVITEYVTGLDLKTLTAEQASAALQTVSALHSVGQAMGKLGLSSGSLSMALVSAFGDVGTMAQALSTYYDVMFTEDEKRARLAQDVAAAFAGLNIEIPTTRDGFKSIVAGLDLTTQQGRDTFAALINLAPAWAQIQVAIDDTTTSIVDNTAKLEEIANTRRDLEIQLMDATGNTSGALEAQRQIELDRLTLLDPTLAALQQQINTQLDLNEANEAAARLAEDAAAKALAVANTQHDLEIRLMQARGDTAGATQALRDIEYARLDALDQAAALAAQAANPDSGTMLGLAPSLADIQRQIDAQNDLNDATARATQALEDAAAAQRQASADIGRTMDVQTSWRDRIALLTGAATQIEIDHRNALAGVTDHLTIKLINEYYAARNAADAATALARAADEQAAAAARLAEQYARVTDGLTNTGRSLEIDLMRAQGDELGALAAQRQIDIAGMDAAQIAIYDHNQALRDQIAAVNAATAAARAAADEERRLAEIRGQIVQGQLESFGALMEQITRGTADARTALTEIGQPGATEKAKILEQYDEYFAAIMSFGGTQTDRDLRAAIGLLDQWRDAQIALVDALEQNKLAEELERIAEATDKWRDSLRGWLDSMLLGDLSPLTAQQQRDEAQRIYVENLLGAQAGDLEAQAALTRSADDYLAAQRAVSGFGGDYSAIFSEIRSQVGALAGVTPAVAPASSADIGALKTEVADLKTVLARLLEIGNADTRESTTKITNAITSSGTRQAAATTEAALLKEKK